MTISTTSNTSVSQGNGFTNTFNFGFIIPLVAELFVTYVDTNDVEWPLSSSQYSVSGLDNPSGGVVTYPLAGSPIPIGSSLIIQRIVAYQQLTSLVNQSGYYPNVVEQALDNLTMQTQQLAAASQLALTVGQSSTAANLSLPSSSTIRSNNLIGFDANGNVDLYPITSSVGAGDLINEGPFVAGVGFTPGVTTSLVLSRSYGSDANVTVHYDAAYQGVDQYSINGDTITFIAPIPVGVNKVYIVGGTTLSVGIPSALSQPNGSSLIGYNQGSTGAATITQQAKNQQVVNLLDICANGVSGVPADPLGVIDSSGAIVKWIALAASGIAVTAPSGTFKFTVPIAIPPISGMSITGAGRQSTKFVYSGTNTTNDLWTIGDGTTSFSGCTIGGFNIDSTTTMTAGTALHIKKQQNGSNFFDISFSNLNATQNLWDGIWFDNTNVTDYIGFEINVQHEALIVNGEASGSSGSDLYLDQGTITNCQQALTVGGGFGGLYVGQVLLYGNLTNVQIDNSRVANGNRELLFSQFCVSDGCKNYGFYIDDTLAGGSNITLNAFVGSAGQVGSGGVGINVNIVAFPNSRITFGMGQLFNATSHNISIQDASTLITIGSETQITNCGGYGINATVQTNNVTYSCTFESNTAGNVATNVRNSYTPTISAATGTITAATGSVYWSRTGSIVYMSVSINVVTNGTGAGAVGCTLPFTVRSATVISGRATGISGKMLQGNIAANSFSLNIDNYDGTYPAVSGETLVLSGCAEVY